MSERGAVMRDGRNVHCTCVVIPGTRCIFVLLLSYYYITLYYINAVCSIYNYTISMQTVVYNSPLYCLLLFFRCILNVYYYQKYYRITIILLLFSSRTSEGVYMTLF